MFKLITPTVHFHVGFFRLLSFYYFILSPYLTVGCLFCFYSYSFPFQFFFSPVFQLADVLTASTASYGLEGKVLMCLTKLYRVSFLFCSGIVAKINILILIIGNWSRLACWTCITLQNSFRGNWNKEVPCCCFMRLLSAFVAWESCLHLIWMRSILQFDRN